MGRKRKRREPSLEEKRESVNEELAMHKAGIRSRNNDNDITPAWFWLVLSAIRRLILK
jgi:hypothetical protein